MSSQQSAKKSDGKKVLVSKRTHDKRKEESEAKKVKKERTNAKDDFKRLVQQVSDQSEDGGDFGNEIDMVINDQTKRSDRMKEKRKKDNEL